MHPCSTQVQGRPVFNDAPAAAESQFEAMLAQVPGGATGPFGDIKNYTGRDFYLSWYPSGLRADSAALAPATVPPLDASAEHELCHSILDALAALLPATARIADRIDRMKLAGGWVFAAGRGALSDPESSLHRRSDFGIVRSSSYISVDTGKYATARRIVDAIAAHAPRA